MSDVQTPRTPGSPGRARNLLFGLVWLALGVLAAAGLAELALRRMALNVGRVSTLSHPVLHHVHQPGITEVFSDPAGEIRPHPVRFAPDGRIVDAAAEPAAPAAPPPHRVALLGDSFVEAAQVDYGDSFAGRLARRWGPAAEVRNYGVASYSPVLHRLQWIHAIGAWRPTHVLLMLYDNDVADDLMYATGAVRDPDGSIAAVPGTGRNWTTRLGRASYLARFLRSTWLRWQWNRRMARNAVAPGDGRPRYPDAMPDLTAAQLHDLASRARGAGAAFVLTAVPRPPVEAERLRAEGRPTFSEVCGAWARTNGIAFLDLQAPFDRADPGPEGLFFRTDIHFTACGHRVVADAIAAAFPDLPAAHAP